MQKSKILLVTLVTVSVVGIINIASAVVAYQFLVPDDVENQELLITSAGPVEPLPVPGQNSLSESAQPSTNESVIQSSSPVTFRNGNQSLVAGQKPMPTAIVTDKNGNKKYQWCSGVNPELPDDVCQTVIAITSYPAETNPHLGDKAKESLSLLPSDTSLTMNEMSWSPIGTDSGTMLITARTTEYGDVPIKVLFVLRNGIWILEDGQIAE
jgi:hypothetical protein